MKREDIFQYVGDTYGTEADYPWMKYPDYAVLRHAGSGKWYGVLMNLPKDKLGLKGGGCIDVINLKCDPNMIGSLRMQDGILPAYHMSKEHWVTVVLDGAVPGEQLRDLIDLSYDLTKESEKNSKFKMERHI